MKRRLFILVLFVIGVFSLLGFSESEDNNTHHISLHNDNNAYGNIKNDLYIKGYQTYLNKSVSEIAKAKSFIELTLKTEPSEHDNILKVEGNGAISIEGKKYPFNFSKEHIAKDTTLNNKTIYFGPVNATISNGDKTHLTLGIEYIPSEDKAYITASMGYLNPDKGTAFLFFGEPFVTKELANKIYNLGDKK